jgi:hypothetical protein
LKAHACDNYHVRCMQRLWVRGFAEAAAFCNGLYALVEDEWINGRPVFRNDRGKKDARIWLTRTQKWAIGEHRVSCPKIHVISEDPHPDSDAPLLPSVKTIKWKVGSALTPIEVVEYRELWELTVIVTEVCH